MCVYRDGRQLIYLSSLKCVMQDGISKLGSISESKKNSQNI